jgi:hypothetical protein
MAEMLDLTRREQWLAAFADEIDRQRQQPFAWNGCDCWTGLLGGVVAALTGTTLPDVSGRYACEESAVAAMREEGADDLGEYLAQRFPEIPPSFARVGDVGLIPADNPLGGVIGIFDTSGLIVMTEQGHGRLRRERATRAFKIG